MPGKKVKEIQRALARNGMFFFYNLLKFLPYAFVNIFGEFLVRIGFVFVIHQKKIANESLRIAFGQEKTESERKEIIRKCFRTFGMGMIEMVYFMSHPQVIEEKVTCEGLEHLEKALKAGKGAIAVTAHYGNFPLMMLYTAYKNYPTNSIIRPVRDEKLNEFLLARREALGVKTVYAHPRQRCVNQSIKVLRDNEILFIPMDQNFGSGKGVFVDFFGQKAATATGPVVFSLRTGAPIIPMFILRQPDNTHKIVISPPLKVVRGRDEQETIHLNIAKITLIIEQYIREYPYEWGWMHRRWKSQPAA